MDKFERLLLEALTKKELDHVGFFIKLPKELAEQYPDMDKDGDTSPPHITLLYIGKADEKELKKIKKVGREIINNYKKMECFVGGLAWFSKEKQIAHSMVECKGLAKLNRDLWDALLNNNIKVEHKFAEYTPHATICCLDKRNYDGAIPQGSFFIDEIELWVGTGETIGKFKLK